MLCVVFGVCGVCAQGQNADSADALSRRLACDRHRRCIYPSEGSTQYRQNVEQEGCMRHKESFATRCMGHVILPQYLHHPGLTPPPFSGPLTLATSHRQPTQKIRFESSGLPASRVCEVIDPGWPLWRIGECNELNVISVCNVMNVMRLTATEP